MIIREYRPADCKELAELFYHTVHIVNAKDYTKEQLDAWATGKVDLKKWKKEDTKLLKSNRQNDKEFFLQILS